MLQLLIWKPAADFVFFSAAGFSASGISAETLKFAVMDMDMCLKGECSGCFRLSRQRDRRKIEWKFEEKNEEIWERFEEMFEGIEELIESRGGV